MFPITDISQLTVEFRAEERVDFSRKLCRPTVATVLTNDTFWWESFNYFL